MRGVNCCLLLENLLSKTAEFKNNLNFGIDQINIYIYFYHTNFSISFIYIIDVAFYSDTSLLNCLLIGKSQQHYQTFLFILLKIL